MPINKISVSEEDISYAENILFNNKFFFDTDRKKYINDFETLDLHAVPGSGKTTLLLAKLLILEKNLPLENNRGVLVLSHTNTAVDEIKSKIKHQCPLLFKYPNFVGTIQQFANKFLAMPFYERTLKKKIYSLDDDYYNNALQNTYCYGNYYYLRGYLEKQYDGTKFMHSVRNDYKTMDLIEKIDGKEENFRLKDKNGKSYGQLKALRSEMIRSGILCFDDAYYLAHRYIINHPQIIEILQERFQYVFVDEMQDMGNHQYSLLENIFYNNGNSQTFYQRLGDNNQSIFESKSTQSVWVKRDKTLKINNSYRLNEINGNLVSRFSLDGSQINGVSGSENHKPLMYVYSQEKRRCDVIKHFSNDVEKIIGENKKITVKAVARRKSTGKAEHTALDSYCPNYNSFCKGKESYSIQNLNDTTLLSHAIIGDIIFGYIIKNFRENNIKIENKIVTRTNLLDFFEGINYKISFKEMILQLSKKIKKNDLTFNECLSEINEQILSIGLEIFKKKINILEASNTSNTGTNNFFECDKCKVFENEVEISTVHSVKGETHDATIFLESFYDSKYESDILHKILLGSSVTSLLDENERNILTFENEILEIKEKGKTWGITSRENKIEESKRKILRIKEYTKVVFVALSRSTSIVGYALKKEKFDEYLLGNQDIDKLWDIKHLE